MHSAIAQRYALIRLFVEDEWQAGSETLEATALLTASIRSVSSMTAVTRRSTCRMPQVRVGAVEQGMFVSIVAAHARLPRSVSGRSTHQNRCRPPWEYGPTAAASRWLPLSHFPNIAADDAGHTMITPTRSVPSFSRCENAGVVRSVLIYLVPPSSTR